MEAKQEKAVIKEIRTVAILGAGAIGAYYIAGLQEKLGDNIWVVAEGDRKKRLEQDGLVINGRPYPVAVKTPAESYGVDLLLVAVKYGALAAALDDIAAIVGPDTTVMSLMNGVDSEERIGSRIGMEHMVYSLMFIAAERIGNAVNFDLKTTKGLTYGEANQSEPSDRVLAIQQLLQDTIIRYRISSAIVQDIWNKYALNICKNLPQAMVNCGLGAYETSEHVAAISQALFREVVAVATAKGIAINQQLPGNSGIAPTARFSTLQDLDAKRQTEVDMFAGTMMRMGAALGIPVPYNTMAFHMIKALEEKNSGNFDF